MKKYITYLSLLMFSLMGTDLTDFALSIWILDQPDGSISLYSFVWFCEAAPAVFLAPVIGSLIDRWNKKKMIIYGQLVAGIGSMILMTLHYLGQLHPWHIMIVAGVGSIASTFVFQAFYVSTKALVPKDQLVRAQGLSSTLNATIQMGLPIVAPILYKLIGMSNIFLFDGITFFTSVIAFSILSFVVVEISSEKFSMKNDYKVVKEFVKQQKGFLYLYSFFFLINFLVGLITVLFTPLILDFSNEYVLGLVLACVGVGSLIGGGAMASKKTFNNPIQIIIWANVFVGLILISFFIQVNPWILGIGGMMILALISVSAIVNEAFFQTVVPTKILGRLTGFSGFFIGTAAPLSFLLSGFVVDQLNHFFKANTIDFMNHFPGTSITTSIVVVFVIAGSLLTILSLIYRRNPNLKKLDALYKIALEKK
ncbi:MFS transporter [Aquimarina sp. TRL1]|uniref:MFS transporter n=1 Tax=Aquimarina sp. (strain TRL1) TaxID=2736252 RepID=UPI00158C7242|nr:MFS transporter [Aquimarina sp. TRL1]QKX03652.1 MFS transporter [Aquimarina sp. TRL1]